MATVTYCIHCTRLIVMREGEWVHFTGNQKQCFDSRYEAAPIHLPE